MKKIAVYCRTSTERQSKGLESQRRALMEYCKIKNLPKPLLYEDFGISGAKTSRPHLDRLMDDAFNGELSKVIVYSFSRFARSTVSANLTTSFNLI